MSSDAEVLAYTVFFILFWIIIGFFAVLYTQNKTVKRFLPKKYNEMDYTDCPIFTFKTRCTFENPPEFGLNAVNYLITSLLCWLFSKVYLYDDYMIVRYLGYSQKFEYNENYMSIKKDYINTYLIIGTPAGNIYLTLNKQQQELLKNLINNR